MEDVISDYDAKYAKAYAYEQLVDKFADRLIRKVSHRRSTMRYNIFCYGMTKRQFRRCHKNRTKLIAVLCLNLVQT